MRNFDFLASRFMSLNYHNFNKAMLWKDFDILPTYYQAYSKQYEKLNTVVWYFPLLRFLYKLHFQQLLLLESYTKLLQLLSGAAGSSGVLDMSDQVAGVRSSLLTALADTLTPPGSPGHGPGTPNRASTPSPATGMLNMKNIVLYLWISVCPSPSFWDTMSSLLNGSHHITFPCGSMILFFHEWSVESILQPDIWSIEHEHCWNNHLIVPWDLLILYTHSRKTIKCNYLFLANDVIRTKDTFGPWMYGSPNQYYKLLKFIDFVFLWFCELHPDPRQ